MATKKFSELDSIDQNTIEEGDLFVLSDASDNVSKNITFSALKSALSGDLLIDPTNDVIQSTINKMNDVQWGTFDPNYVAPTNKANGLGANFLYDSVDGNYKSGEYVLNYNNLRNLPDIPVNITDLTNNNQTVRYNSQTNRLEFFILNTGATGSISTSEIPEGTNLYYSDNRVKNYFDNNFADYYNAVTSSFDDGFIIDSVYGQGGTFRNVVNSQSNRIRIEDTTLISRFRSGQILRVYGASVDGINQEIGDYTFSLIRTGFSPSGTYSTTFTYKTCLFDLDSGKISPATAEQQVAFAVPVSQQSIYNNPLDMFSVDYFIRLTFSSVPAGKGVAVYRKNGQQPDFKLVAVLGTKDISQGSWVDYYTYDYVSWSGKNPSDNTYVLSGGDSNVIHFQPTNPASESRRGWADVQVSSVVDNVSSFDIVLSNSLFVNPSVGNIYPCTVCHNDTQTIQTAINANFNAGRKNIALNPKSYIASILTLPDNFGVIGTESITKIRKLPWSGGNSAVTSASMIKSQSNEDSNNIVLSGIDLIGEATNQFLFVDISGNNYAVDLGNRSVDARLTSVRILNVAGGGIYSPNPIGFTLTGSKIQDSGITDRNLFSPLVIPQGQNTFVTSNVIGNFTDYIDASTTDKGLITDNIIFNSGSGILIAGSRFTQTSNNVITGPADELIVSSDVLNSVYDSVNIEIEPDQPFTSPEYKYQENGNNFNLIQNTKNNLIYDIWKLEKLPSGSENLYEKITDVTLNDVVGLDKTQGEFQFTISISGVNTLLTTHSAENSLLTNSNHVGIIYRAMLEEYVLAGNISANNGTVTDPLQPNRYTIVVSNPAYLSVGATVELVDHTGFSTTPNNTVTGTVVASSYVSGNNANATITIEFDNDVNTVGSSGTINIINKFTLAKGTILNV